MADDEYEQERLENIRKNRELLLSLGLNPAPPTTSKAAPKIVKSKRQKRAKEEEEEAKDEGNGNEGRRLRPKRQLPSRGGVPVPLTTTKVSEAFPEATRKSARLSGQPSKMYNEDESIRRLSSFRTDDFPPAPRLKRLRNPSPPPEQPDEPLPLDDAPLPKRDARGNILFENNNRHFMPNVTPAEMIKGGIFGGTALRPFYSRIVKQDLQPDAEMREWPSEWLDGVDVKRQLTGETYRPEENRFGVKAGQSLEEWESAGWVRSQDPRGWWQWYFRFYLGRRTTDDARQIGRWQKACGPAGRFKRSLVAKVHQARTTWDDESVSPVVRQTLFHWAYALTEHDYHAYLPS